MTRNVKYRKCVKVLEYINHQIYEVYSTTAREDAKDGNKELICIPFRRKHKVISI